MVFSSLPSGAMWVTILQEPVPSNLPQVPE